MKKRRFNCKKCVLLILSIASFFCIIKFSKLSVWGILPNFIERVIICPNENTDAYELLMILNNLSMAYIASLIFFVVIDLIPRLEKEKKAFNIISGELGSIYDNLSYIIRLILFEIELNKPVEKISLTDVAKVKNLELDSPTMYADITHVRNGEDLHIKDFAFNLFDACKKRGESITKSIDRIFELQIAENLDNELVESISELKGCGFLNLFSHFERQNMKKIPRTQNIILNFDNYFFELIQYREYIGNYKRKIDLLDYRFEKMPEDKIRERREQMVYWVDRQIFMRLPVERILSTLAYMSNIVLNDSKFHRLNGVLQEALVTYDIDRERYVEVLSIAKMIADFLRKYEGSETCKDLANINYLQVIKRQGNVAVNDLQCAMEIIGNPDKPVTIRLGALIICERYEEALALFNDLDGKEQLDFTGLPIYKLWVNAPLPAKEEPPFFTLLESN